MMLSKRWNLIVVAIFTSVWVFVYSFKDIYSKFHIVENKTKPEGILRAPMRYTLTYTMENIVNSTSRDTSSAARVIIKVNSSVPSTIQYGGDVISVRVFVKDKDISFALSSIDRTDGTYVCTIPSLWEGQYTMEVRLLIPSLTVQFLRKYQSENFYEISWTRDAVYRRDGIEKKVECDLASEYSHYCDLSEYNGMDPWFCPLPSGMRCEDFVFEHQKSLLPEALEENKHLFNNMFVKTVFSISPKSLTMVPDDRQLIQSEEECLINSKRLHFPTGYFTGNKWNSRICSHQHYSPSQAMHCLKNKTILFFGDSNSRKLKEIIMENLKGFKTINDVRLNKYIYPELNSSLELHLLGHGIGNWPQKGQVLESIDSVFLFPRPEVDVIFVSFWAHFTFLSERRFTEKLLYLRTKLRAWKTKYPHSIIVLRSPHFRELRYPSLNFLRFNNFNAQQTYNIYKRVFHNEPFYFMDMYEMVIAYGGEYNVHPNEHVVHESLNWLLSRICPTGK